MPVEIQCKGLPVSKKEAVLIWNKVVAGRGVEDDQVTVRCVSKSEITGLNTQYRNSRKATNVLTFSYGNGEHDIALCLEMAKEETKVCAAAEKDYIAWLLVHAFLHASGMNHEESISEAGEMEVMEKDILTECGYQRP